MPRFVRNAYIEGSADGVATPFGTGPRERGGWLSGRITLRTADGDVSRPIEVSAGGRNAMTGTAHAYIRVPAGMSVAVNVLANGEHELHITQDPA